MRTTSKSVSLLLLACLALSLAACLPTNLINPPASQNDLETAVYATLTSLTQVANTSQPIAPTHTAEVIPVVNDTPTATQESQGATPAPTFTATPMTLLPQSVVIEGLGCIPRNTQQDLGIVTNVIDGDTFQAIIDGQVKTIKNIGIDAPALASGSNPGGRLAEDAFKLNKLLIEGKIVILVKDVSESDSSGALLRYVLADNLFINYALVKQGLAVALATPPDVTCRATLETAMQVAMGQLTGLWKATPTSTDRPNHLPSLTPTFAPSDH